MATNFSGKTRLESDLIGEMQVPVEALYGVQTLRGIENFPISRFHLSDYPLFINGLAMTKLAAAENLYSLIVIILIVSAELKTGTVDFGTFYQYIIRRTRNI